jgi:hypothetical protein
LDVPEDFGHHERLGPEQWAPTVPLNASTPFPEERGLPPIGAGIDETYSVGQRLSQLRIAFAAPCDGVYCPICHIANTQLAKLHTPCPQCNRSLLRFGWV